VQYRRMAVRYSACLSNQMSDLTQSLWLISEKPTAMFAKRETSFTP